MKHATFARALLGQTLGGQVVRSWSCPCVAFRERLLKNADRHGSAPNDGRAIGWW